ncbi:hypothetical protein J2S53_002554 [Actinopolyspora lacussalsi]|nr:hypothetical protein [Actinopolyspora lacussalsi]
MDRRGDGRSRHDTRGMHRGGGPHPCPRPRPQDSLPIEEAVEEAHYPGGPSRESIRAQIIRQRYEAEEVAARPAQ